ncbi:heavy-metal-associated domain-containing protein [Flavobacterium paronense]|uniref:Heavy-metal-associated domain-containing protein n=1 Tax=Flavobacterium paronense TaxID=1392775 RepID=A0ABV5GBL5_9FLAO|nr:heavy-metal-associated domain-containing protein [Flavobacterium paronense]MDN3677651.1 heavy-metal-associated domain-containing protein [Flavobacterium paronense]
MEQQIIVENIKCGGCMNSIQTALLKLDKVEKVVIDKETDTITITGDVEKALLIKKLNELGYPEKGDNSLLKIAKSYVNCAIGKMN